MFGFGRPAQEKAVINLFALQLQELGISETDALTYATRLVDEVLAEIPHGFDPFKSTQGNEYAAREQFTAPRLKAGLTIDNIKFHWNRPLLVVLVEDKLRYLYNNLVIMIAKLEGRDVAAAAQNYKKTFPRYGDPTKWDPSDKFNIGLLASDADIYTEFAGRVDAWRRKTPEAEFNKLIAEHGTLNAAIRHLVSLKLL